MLREGGPNAVLRTSARGALRLSRCALCQTRLVVPRRSRGLHRSGRRRMRGTKREQAPALQKGELAEVAPLNAS